MAVGLGEASGPGRISADAGAVHGGDLVWVDIVEEQPWVYALPARTLRGRLHPAHNLMRAETGLLALLLTDKNDNPPGNDQRGIWCAAPEWLGNRTMNWVMRRSDEVPSGFDRRGERLFRELGKWFYHIRDGRRGPFDNRQAAHEDLQRFVVTRNYMESHPDRVPDDLDIDDVTHIELRAPLY